VDVIEITGLTKAYKRLRRGRTVTHVALDGLDLSVPSGGVFGFLGPNGSGKTTTIRCLLGLTRPTAGTCRLLGRAVPAALHEVAGRVGAIVEQPALFPTMSARRNLEILARIEGIGPTTVATTLERVGLGERADELVKTYSLGMRQRLALGAALLKDPEVLLLDEPANGLDPSGIREIRTLMRGLGDEGRTVFVSSHHLAEIEHTCDAVAILNGGRCIAAGSVQDVLHSRQAPQMVVAVHNMVAAAEVLLGAGVHSRPDGDRLIVDIEASGAAWLNRVLADAGLWLTELRPAETSLEDVFLTLTGAAQEVA
jgi:ABC-2 type transport system ATP-binding protein